MNTICKRPFSEIEINDKGEVFVCCPDWTNKYSIGCLFNKDGSAIKSFDEVWYSDKAIQLRKSLLNGSYKYCNVDMCFKKCDSYDNENIQYVERPDYPMMVRFAYDRQCNINCMICRDNPISDGKNQNEKFDAIFENILIPIMKNAKLVSLTTAGEVTASAHSQKLIKETIKKYPDVKFHISTNGLLFNEQFCEKLGLLDRLLGVVVSLHGMTKNTYEKIMRGSNFETVMKNLKWLIELKKENKLQDLLLVFCISSLNYKEIPMIVKFAVDNDINLQMWEFRIFNDKIEMSKNYKKYAVWQKSHPEYNKFVKVISEVKYKYKNCTLPQFICDLKPRSLKETILYKLHIL